MSRRRRFQRVGIVAKVASREAVHTAHELAEWLRRRGLDAALDEATLRARGARRSRVQPRRRPTTWWWCSAATARCCRRRGR